ncbi:MAG: Bax inhibitor-1/YccA family protein [Fusobacterium sp.]|nr:Bax inhibitor-1/YccA family protein [Fusobacterium sp.]
MENNENNSMIPRNTSNPAFNPEYLAGERVLDGEPMTVNGTINKTGICLALVFIAAAFSWSLVTKGFMDMAQGLSVVSLIAAFVLGFVIIFKRMSPVIQYLVPVYALLEGAFLGFVSAMFEASFPGIIQTAIKSTILCVAVMLILFKTGVIKVTEKLRAGVIMCTATVAGVYLIDLLLSLFGIRVPAINAATPLGIGISVVIVGIAAFNLLLDFDFIYEASRRMLPKFVEWYGAFGLMVTIIWLYIEILKLLAKLQRRR